MNLRGRVFATGMIRRITPYYPKLDQLETSPQVATPNQFFIPLTKSSFPHPLNNNFYIITQ